MFLDPDTVLLLRSVPIIVLTILLVGKVCRECSAEQLRQRIRALESDLFEIARRGSVGFRDPAYLLLMNRLRAAVQASHELTLTRQVIFTLLKRKPGAADSDRGTLRDVETALSMVSDAQAREEMRGLRDSLSRQLAAHLALGSIPFGVAAHGRLRMWGQHARATLAAARMNCPAKSRMQDAARAPATV